VLAGDGGALGFTATALAFKKVVGSNTLPGTDGEAAYTAVLAKLSLLGVLRRRGHYKPGEHGFTYEFNAGAIPGREAAPLPCVPPDENGGLIYFAPSFGPASATGFSS
jgi:hypothetical protein